ncbi:MAG: hypothetical protein ACRDS0_09100 [Pseudonocardiaceae bacterium]
MAIPMGGPVAPGWNGASLRVLLLIFAVLTIGSGVFGQQAGQRR